MFEVVRYTPDRAGEWDEFVAHSKNGTFLFNRAYMDYHADRFDDFSLMIYRRGTLFALLLGNAVDEVYYSHQGLTYGGLVMGSQATAVNVCEAFIAINSFLRNAGFRRVLYKTVPHIYHRMPAEEDLFALFLRCQAKLVERDVSSTLLLGQSQHRFEESRRSGIRKAQRKGIEIRESNDVDAFWNILTSCLEEKYNSKPVHTVEEMKLLMGRFPDDIKLLMAFSGQTPLAGTVLYLTPEVVHTQYISASTEGKQNGALDLLFDFVINGWGLKQRYFDFGTSAQTDSCELNASLIFQKLGFGARAVCYDRYVYQL